MFFFHLSIWFCSLFCLLSVKHCTSLSWSKIIWPANHCHHRVVHRCQAARKHDCQLSNQVDARKANKRFKRIQSFCSPILLRSSQTLTSMIRWRPPVKWIPTFQSFEYPCSSVLFKWSEMFVYDPPIKSHRSNERLVLPVGTLYLPGLHWSQWFDVRYVIGVRVTDEPFWKYQSRHLPHWAQIFYSTTFFAAKWMNVIGMTVDDPGQTSKSHDDLQHPVHSPLVWQTKLDQSQQIKIRG